MKEDLAPPQKEVTVIPPGVDIQDLAEQLNHDHVAFTNPQLSADLPLQQTIASALEPGEAIAVIDTVPGKAADLRDVAQELSNATGAETVFVQSPQQVSIVSSEYSRATIESFQEQVPAVISQVDLVNQFHDFTPDHHVPWGIVMAVILAVSACAFVASYKAARN